MSTACIARTLAAAISSSGDVCSTAVFAPPLTPEAASPSEDISKEEEAGAKNEPRVKVSPAAAAAATSSAF